MDRLLRSVVPRLRAALVLPLALAACDGADPTEPAPPRVGELTVDASAAWAFTGLGETARIVSVSDPAASDVWDVAFFATGVMLNGGAAGPGGVEGYCVCQNGDPTDAQVLTMTPETELADFLAVDMSSLPADSLWKSDALAAAIRDWFAYDPRTHTVSADTSRVWLVRTAGSSPSFAKLRVRRIENAAREHAGTVTLEYALQPAAGAPVGETRSLAVDLSSGGRVHVDLESGQVVAASSDWDLALEGYAIRVNGGVSGSGQAGAVLAGEPFATIGDAGSAPVSVYAGDAFGGVFDAHRWYRYDLRGEHQIWPTYQVYLIRRRGEVYKVQLTGYYGAGRRDAADHDPLRAPGRLRRRAWLPHDSAAPSRPSSRSSRGRGGWTPRTAARCAAGWWKRARGPRSRAP